MPIPVSKSILTLIRISLRPVNNTLIKMFKASSKEKKGLGYNFFVFLGQRFNRFEVFLNRVVIQQMGLGEIKAIPDELAFNKGVEWFTEIIFFYGVLFGISIYEMRRSLRWSSEIRTRLAECSEFNEKSKNRLDASTTTFESVRKLSATNNTDI